jgi:pimeloyl-ACP methyl ester carboxylesterase
MANHITYVDHDRGRAHTFLVLHGGGGPGTVAGFAALLAERKHARVIVPTHPGFAGTERPAELSSVKLLAQAYLELLASLELRDVIVIGNSMGGWIAAEMGLATHGRVGAVVLVNAVGVVVPEHPMRDVGKLAPHELAALSFHRPEAFAQGAAAAPGGPPKPSPNIAALVAYAGRDMCDPTLLARLARLAVPAHVVWGESDRVVTPDYGRTLAAAIPGAKFTLVRESGHLPQLETPEALLAVI